MMMKRREVLAAGTVAAAALPGKPAHAAAQILTVTPPEAAPQTPFFTAAGASRTLADYRGKSLLVNLWATWCAPCVQEMPSLAAAARTLRGLGFAVLPISSDMGGAPRVEAFFKQHGISGLPVLIDRNAALLHAFGAPGLPSTYVIDRAGRIVGRKVGGMDWDRRTVIAELKELAGIRDARRPALTKS